VRLRLSALLLLAVLVLGLSACGGDDEESSGATTTAATTTSSSSASGGCEPVTPPSPPAEDPKKPTKALDAGKQYRLIFATNCGIFTIQLDQKLAPKTTASLVSLVEQKFFNGLTFHRVVPGFVIQGGDPTGTGTGGPGYQTVDPPPQDAKYTKGVVAMAKTLDEAPGTAGSQFFIVTGADAGLPPDYAIVGKVVSGDDTIAAIDALGTTDGPPSQPVVIDKVTIEVK
jgi:cyclophilin family peptidyl-prolyl cis-trans isomerase